MTLKNRYDEVMKNIEVTDEMKNKILNKINNLDFDKIPNKVVFFRNYKKYISIAACFVVLLVGSIISHNAFHMPDDFPVQVVSDIVEMSSSSELSKDVGFTVKEIYKLPFDVKSIKYTSYWGELADITYTGSNNTAIFRMANCDEDVSGYSDEFTSVESHFVNGYNVTIKGKDDQYILAVWQKDGYSYSVQFIESVSKQKILDTIQSIK